VRETRYRTCTWPLRMGRGHGHGYEHLAEPIPPGHVSAFMFVRLCLAFFLLVFFHLQFWSRLARDRTSPRPTGTARGETRDESVSDRPATLRARHAHSGRPPAPPCIPYFTFGACFAAFSFRSGVLCLRCRREIRRSTKKSQQGGDVVRRFLILLETQPLFAEPWQAVLPNRALCRPHHAGERR
jgi:hypothetical protein